METNLYSCTHSGRTNSEKTMEDGNNVNIKDDKITTTTLTNIYSERLQKLAANGHEFAGEPSSPPEEPYETCRLPADTTNDDKTKKRINPLRIHLGKRPFVDNSLQYLNASKKRKRSLNKICDSSTPANFAPRVPKLIPKHIEHNQFHNVSSQAEKDAISERDKPVPRLVPKSQLLQFKKGKAEKGAHLKEYAQSLGLQPMVKFKCRKCCSMSFKTLAMLKEHQLVCRAQAKEPALSPEAAPCPDVNTSGPSRVTRKVYLCSACGTYYENWNLFLHMREVHNRHICLFCLGMFSKAEKLSSHLTNKHNVNEFSFDSKEEFLNVYNGTLYLMCCACDEICSEQDDFFNHDCNNVKPKPVPVLISKNSVKANNLKNVKSYNEISSNGPTNVAKELVKPVLDISEPKFDTVTPQLHHIKAADSSIKESVISDATVTSAAPSNDSKNIDSGIEHSKSPSSPILHSNFSYESHKEITNGDEREHSDDSDDSLDSDGTPAAEAIKPSEVIPTLEKDCGIKLKLSLNNAKSPVIINSTVDPTIGQHHALKPPTRTRRPPKRYEKETPREHTAPPKQPSIKMTICDRADSPFVKTTIFENNKETTLKTLLNNNLESASNNTDIKLDNNAIKTTIYDNKLDDTNTLNRVPKLTVRVPKELLDKDSSSDYSSDSDVSDKLTVDENNTTQEEPSKIEQNETIVPQIEPMLPTPVETPAASAEEPQLEDDDVNVEDTDLKTEPKTEPDIIQEPAAEATVEEPAIPLIELSLDKPLDKYPLKDLLKVFLSSTVLNCIYCNHVRKIAVNCEQLALHMVAQHRFTATVNSITAEELMPETITAKLKTGAEELKMVYINLDSYDSVDKCDEMQYDYIFECFQCYFKTAIHKDLYLHNRKMHQKTILLCVMCKSNFYSYSELLCHLCPGTYDSEYEIKFRCCLCNVDSIPSPFRLMVHLRKIHHTCDVCLELCHSQARLSNHVWKHKLHHLCYRCGIAYRNKPDITNHLFWKHGTESVMCKKCLQKKWPHVYHFCTPPAVFVCDECSLQFTRAVYLKVHKRFHTNEYPHICVEEECTEKFVSKKLLDKHSDEHRKKLFIEDITEDKPKVQNETLPDSSNETVPIIDLVDDKPKEEAGTSDVKAEPETEQVTKKEKKKKNRDKDALLLDVNLPALNLSESDSSDESDSGFSPAVKDEVPEEKPIVKIESEPPKIEMSETNDAEVKLSPKTEETPMQTDEKPSEQQVLDIWDNFKKYQAKVEKTKEKTPPLVPIRKHVCESDHDYCLVPTDFNGDDDIHGSHKKKSKKTPKKHRGGLSSSSSSSSDSDSSCSCGSNCSCSSSSGSSSSSSSDSDSSNDSRNGKKKMRRIKKTLPNRRLSTGSNVDVMGMSETPILIPEKTEPPIAETDLETDESETDEEFYDKNPQHVANKLKEEKQNQVISTSSATTIDGEQPTIATSPIKDENEMQIEPELEPEPEPKVRSSSGKKKSKKKKKSKSSKKHGPIKINIPKDVIAQSGIETQQPVLVPNKITISLQSNTVQIPETPKTTPHLPELTTPTTSLNDSKRASKRRRVRNKFYGYSSDEDGPHTPVTQALKPQQPPKLEWRKEDLPSPVTNKTNRVPLSTVLPSRTYNYTDNIRLTAPIPDPEPPRILMNTESMESSDSDSSDEGNLEIYQPNSQSNVPPPPTYLNSGTSSLPYAFERPAVREAREGESVYCYCRCPYDEVSEMIACDAEGCPIEWFHFECVGIMVPPKGKWYCPECRKNQSFSGYR